MSKIYRLHTGAGESIQDWTEMGGYIDEAQIKKIADPAGARTQTRITSIPSPFAGIDLVKTAFRQVTDSGTPAGLTMFHKLVSDALDVGQVFFNSTQLADKIDIMSWNPGLGWLGKDMTVDDHSDLDQLLNAGSANHRLYGETLRMYFAQDAKEYNFDLLKQFYLLNYKDGKGELNIIGGTSPATLFFASANKLDYVHLNFGNDKLFDGTYCPLHERSEDYILFLYSLRKSVPYFSERFNVIDAYLDLCLPMLAAATNKKVRELTPESYRQNYNSIDIAGIGNHPEITGIELRCAKIDIGEPGEKSDFVIKTKDGFEGLKPLVLPAYAFNLPLNYVNGIWPTQLKAPYFDVLLIADRTLPGSMVKYPYITTSDFFEPFLMALPFEPDADKFFTGYFPKGNNEGYLLPLTTTFFNYFNALDLTRKCTDGRAMFEFEKLPANAVKAKLHIPIKDGRFIDMERIYMPEMVQTAQSGPDLSRNQGIIKSRQFSIAIYPFVKRGIDKNAFYSIMLLDHDINHGTESAYKVKYYKDAIKPQPIANIIQRKKSNMMRDKLETTFDVVESEFDFMMIENGKMRGCLIPLFPVKNQHNRSFTFSVDFGTTNTHIEYSVDIELSQSFDISRDDQQLATLHIDNVETAAHLSGGKFGIGATMLLTNVTKELMPELIGGTSKYKFPQRTAIAEPLNVDFNNKTQPLADFSIYWQYEEAAISKQLKSTVNLKWGNRNSGPETTQRMDGYIANLVLLMRNKVLLNGGDLAKTKIIWFYPTSMSRGRINDLTNTWERNVKRYMAKEVVLESFPEAIAPFYYFCELGGAISDDKPSVNIDIGGGTTDIVVFKNKNIVAHTSFKFAGNALFGDGYNKNASVNGFVQFFENEYRQSLKDSALSIYLPPLDSRQKSEEFITKLFGLQNHPDRKEVFFSFTEKLRATEELKLVPLLFISSIFYHIAKLQKARQDDIPRHITFSGTASKMLAILDVTRDLNSIRKLANHIFNEVFTADKADIRFVVAEGPKEVTARGGLCNPQDHDLEKEILSGAENVIGKKELTYKEACERTVQDAVLTEVTTFIDHFFEWNSKLNFSNEFSINTLRFALFKDKLKEDLDAFLSAGISELQTEMSRPDEEKIDETLFFMPLKGALNNLAFFITENKITR